MPSSEGKPFPTARPFPPSPDVGKMTPLPSTTMSTPLFIAIVVQGGANLVPWQVFIALVDYFQFTYQSNVMEFYFPVISTGVLVVTAVVMTLMGHHLSFSTRIY